MNWKNVLRVVGFLVMLGMVWGNSAPVVSAVTATQRPDDSKLVDIYYDLADADGDICTVWVVVSLDGGTTWSVPAVTFTGAIGAGQTPGTNKHIIWDAGKDMPGKTGNFKARIFTDDGNGLSPMVVVGAGSFAYQRNYNDPIHIDAFMIDKYEVTVGHYCQFLNASDPDGNHWDTNQEIERHGNPGAYTFSPQLERENYPIRYVNYFDAVAFAAWRSGLEGVTYRLPTEEEWEKAAGWDPILQMLWSYACQRNSIDCTWANYENINNCYGLPLPVGSFNGNAGKNNACSYYGCYDMTGNVWEWTSSMYDGSNNVLRGGYWDSGASYCTVTYRGSSGPSGRIISVGFRLVMDLD